MALCGDIYFRLTRAAAAREEVTIIYHGGSQPGRKRRVAPLAVTADELSAHDLTTGETKTFLLHRLEIVPGDHPAEDYIAHATLTAVSSDLRILLGDRAGELESLGWRVELEMNSIALFRYLKNGKPRKTPTVGLQKFDVDPSWQDGEVVVITPKKRPWYVYGPDLAVGKTFGDANIHGAIAIFINQAKAHAPKLDRSG